MICAGGRSICGELGFVQPPFSGGGSDDQTLQVIDETDQDFYLVN